MRKPRASGEVEIEWESPKILLGSFSLLCLSWVNPALSHVCSSHSSPHFAGETGNFHLVKEETIAQEEGQRKCWSWGYLDKFWHPNKCVGENIGFFSCIFASHHECSDFDSFIIHCVCSHLNLWIENKINMFDLCPAPTVCTGNAVTSKTKALDPCRNEEREHLSGGRRRPLQIFICGVIYLWVGRGLKEREHFEIVT